MMAITYDSLRMRRRGVTILEATVALTVVTAAALALAQLVGTAGKQRRTTYARQMALLEVANQAERIALADWDAVTPELLTTWPASEELLEVLPSAKCAAVVTDEVGQAGGRRIRLNVSWMNAAGQEVEPVSLTIWKFREGQAP
jgi:hypothetical protein